MALSSTQRLRPAAVPTPWTFDEVAGRLVEISSSTAAAALTLTFSLVHEAQQRGEPVGWVTLADRKSTRLNSSHIQKSRMPSSA